jgi:hypothetical protein
MEDAQHESLKECVSALRDALAEATGEPLVARRKRGAAA